MKPETTAIVLIEYQNDFTTVGGVFHEGVKDVMQSNNMLANTVEVANKGRAAGATVMHAPISFAEGYGELTNHPYGILKGVVDNKAFRKGSWGAAIVDVLKPQPEDIVVERGFKPWCWPGFLQIAVWNQPCAAPTNAGSTS
jgi:ureidoacrylate peracid hydrolase